MLLFFILGAIPFSVGLYILASGVRAWRGSHHSFRWPATGGVVRTSKLREEDDGEGGIDYHADVIFEYEVGGLTLSSDQVTYSPTPVGKKSALATLEKYPLGASVVVHYDPDNLSESVLETGTGKLGAHIFVFSAGIVSLGVGAAFMLLSLFSLFGPE